MVPRIDEVVLPWYIRSMDYIRGLQLQVTVATDMSVKPIAIVEDGSDVHVGDVGVDVTEGVVVVVVADVDAGDVDGGVDGGQGATVGDDIVVGEDAT